MKLLRYYVTCNLASEGNEFYNNWGDSGTEGNRLAQTNIQGEQEAVLVPVYYICDYQSRKL